MQPYACFLMCKIQRPLNRFSKTVFVEQTGEYLDILRTNTMISVPKGTMFTIARILTDLSIYSGQELITTK